METERTLHITPHESVTVKRSDAEMLEVEAVWSPGGDRPPAHYHPAQDERFEVLEGMLQVKVGGEEQRELRPGDVLEIPRGTHHQMWNESDAATRAVWRTTPGGRTEQWFASVDAIRAEGRVGRNGMPGPLAFASLLTEFDDVFRLATPAEPVVRGALRLLAPVGRARGYRAVAR